MENPDPKDIMEYDDDHDNNLETKQSKPRRSLRLQRALYSAADSPYQFINAVTHPLQTMLFVATENQPQPFDVFLPEPTSLKAVL